MAHFNTPHMKSCSNDLEMMEVANSEGVEKTELVCNLAFVQNEYKRKNKY